MSRYRMEIESQPYTIHEVELHSDNGNGGSKIGTEDQFENHLYKYLVENRMVYADLIDTPVKYIENDEDIVRYQITVTESDKVDDRFVKISSRVNLAWGEYGKTNLWICDRDSGLRTKWNSRTHKEWIAYNGSIGEKHNFNMREEQ